MVSHKIIPHLYSTGQAPDSEPGLFFAIISVVVIIAVVLVGAIISLVIICIVYYCCTPIPLPPEPEQSQVRANPNARTPQQNAPNPYLTETLPPNYEEHEQYPRTTLSQRSRNSLPRYSLIFKKNRSRRTSQRSQNSVDPATASLPDNEIPERRGDEAV